jgi:hypothetical protein
MTKKLEAGALGAALMFAHLLRQRRLPLRVTEHRFDPTRKGRFDFAWRDAPPL